MPVQRARNIFELVRVHGSSHRVAEFTPTKPTEPSRFLPGTFERLEAYRQRVENGENIWSDEDFDPDD